jgi:hypothetical protein
MQGENVNSNEKLAKTLVKIAQWIVKRDEIETALNLQCNKYPSDMAVGLYLCQRKDLQSVNQAIAFVDELDVEAVNDDWKKYYGTESNLDAQTLKNMIMRNFYVVHIKNAMKAYEIRHERMGEDMLNPPLDKIVEEYDSLVKLMKWRSSTLAEILRELDKEEVKNHPACDLWFETLDHLRHLDDETSERSKAEKAYEEILYRYNQLSNLNRFVMADSIHLQKRIALKELDSHVFLKFEEMCDYPNSGIDAILDSYNPKVNAWFRKYGTFTEQDFLKELSNV